MKGDFSEKTADYYEQLGKREIEMAGICAVHGDELEMRTRMERSVSYYFKAETIRKKLAEAKK